MPLCCLRRLITSRCAAFDYAERADSAMPLLRRVATLPCHVYYAAIAAAAPLMAYAISMPQIADAAAAIMLRR